MKLDAVHGIKAVLHGHDLPVIGDGGDFEIRRSVAASAESEWYLAGLELFGKSLEKETVRGFFTRELFPCMSSFA